MQVTATDCQRRRAFSNMASMQTAVRLDRPQETFVFKEGLVEQEDSGFLKSVEAWLSGEKVKMAERDRDLPTFCDDVVEFNKRHIRRWMARE